jgi:hypothetical protein
VVPKEAPEFVQRVTADMRHLKLNSKIPDMRSHLPNVGKACDIMLLHRMQKFQQLSGLLRYLNIESLPVLLPLIHASIGRHLSLKALRVYVLAGEESDTENGTRILQQIMTGYNRLSPKRQRSSSLQSNARYHFMRPHCRYELIVRKKDQTIQEVRYRQKVFPH